ncbi:MAG: SIS domain-containing protein, partial [Acidimicrobiia bacterium]
MAGELMAAEMDEQPAVLAALVASRAETVKRLRRSISEAPTGIALVARGSSDNAAIFGRYVLEPAARRPVSLVAPSLLTLYRARTDYRGYLAVAISQSGETPEIVGVLTALQDRGAVGLAITNRPDSPLGERADLVVELRAGEERAVPATKTFTAQLACFGFLAEALGEVPWRPEDWERLPEAVRAVLDDPDPAREAARSMVGASGMICVGRGFLYAVALEAALKVKETTSIPAHGYSAADLRHGPIAVVEQAFPVLALLADGPTRADMEDLVATLRERGAYLVLAGEVEEAHLSVPGGPSEPLIA